MLNNYHKPVLLTEVIANLAEVVLPSRANHFWDGTLGGGGYTKAILENFSQGNSLKVTASDLDPMAITNFWDFTGLEKKSYAEKVDLVQGNFATIIRQFSENSLRGIVLDLGFCSNQLTMAKRGFSHQGNSAEPLDLRYDPAGTGLPAYRAIQNLSRPQELSQLLYWYSGEILARKLGVSLWEACQQNDYVTNAMASKILLEKIPAKFYQQRHQILSRVWQALRIWVNQELDSLEFFLSLVLAKLQPQGRLLIVNFHSLEDKLVTSWMRQQAKPIAANQYGDKVYQAKLLTKQAIEPTQEEVRHNPRSRSAKLRVLQKLEFSLADS